MPRSSTPIEDIMLEQIDVFGLPPPTREFQFLPTRKFSADFAWEQYRFILEVDGGVFKPKSGHTSGVGYTRDRERDALAMCEGWSVLRVTSEQVRSGAAILWLKQILSNRIEEMKGKYQ